MAWVNPTSRSTSDLITAAIWNQDVVVNPQYLHDNVNLVQYGCRSSNTVLQVISTGTWTAITFDTDRWDVGGLHNVSSNTHRFVSVGAGKYLFWANIGWETGSTGFRGMRLIDNSATEHARVMINAGSASQNVVLSLSTMVIIAATEWMSVELFHTQGADLDTLKGSNFSPEASLVKIMT